MIKAKRIAFTLLFILALTFGGVCQPYNVTFQVRNQPNNPVIFGAIQGDKFTPIDTTLPVNNSIHFELKPSAHAGVYRIIFGKTTYAKIMNESPQQLDFIYNHEDIFLKTDFNSPTDSIEIVASNENRIWFDFLKKEKQFKQQIQLLEKEVDYYWLKQDTAAAISKANTFNQLQMERALLIDEMSNTQSYASKLIGMQHVPLRDGYTSKEQRDEYFRSEYFKGLNFTDESLINSSVYTDKVFNYLVLYNQKGITQNQRETRYKKAIDIIVENTNANKKVYELVLDYMVSGFESLNMNTLITFIADKYSGTTCQTDEVSTLERKLLQQKMKIGTSVPDFTLNDINDEAVRLKDVLKDRNLILFWASWCPHCIEIIPKIYEWQASSEMTDLQIIAISLDSEKMEWEDTVSALGIDGWYNLSSLQKWDCPVVLDYNVYATPTLFVINSKGIILDKPLTLSQLKAAVSSND